jgi:hypothetical protein
MNTEIEDLQCRLNTHLLNIIENFEKLLNTAELIKENDDINTMNDNFYKDTPIYIDTLIKLNKNIFEKLFILGSNTPTANSHEGSPLHWAARNINRTPILIALITNVTDVNLTCGNVLGWTPCHNAAYHINLKALSILVAAGADLSIKDCYGFIPRDKFTSHYGHSIESFDEACSHKVVQLAGFNAIRKRATEICMAMHDLDLDASRMSEIVIQSCTPFAERLDFHYIWDLVVMVKHFHDRHRKILVK